MSQIEILQKMLSDMDNQIIQLNEHITSKELLIEHTNRRIEELNAGLVIEKEALYTALKKREKMLEMQIEVQSNFTQINESVNTLVEILRTKI